MRKRYFLMVSGMSGEGRGVERQWGREEVEIFSTVLTSTSFLFSSLFSQGREWCTGEGKNLSSREKGVALLYPNRWKQGVDNR